MSLHIARPNATTAIIEMSESQGQSLLETVEELAEEGVRSVILDYAQVGFCNSLDVAQVLSSRSHLLGLGGRLEICNCKPGVVSIYQVLKLDRLFRLDYRLEQLRQQFNLS